MNFINLSNNASNISNNRINIPDNIVICGQNDNDNNNNYNYDNNDDNEIKIINLNHPWFIYPHAFMSEYNNYRLYKTESLRLLKFLKDFINKFDEQYFTNSKILMPIILGSSMEDAIVNYNTDQSNVVQYQQLFPNYINNFIEKVNEHKFIQLIIISPDLIFDDIDYIPLFVKFSKYNFNKINKYEYIHSDNNLIIKVNIFNCPMVSKENRKNIIVNCDKILNNCKKIISGIEIDTYVQSETDLILINKIYSCIDKIFSYTKTNFVNTIIDSGQIKKINIIVNSWVSFKNLYGYSENYNMFSELLNLASKYNIIATEWEFKDDCVNTIIKSCYHFGNLYFKHKKIIYVDNFVSFDYNYDSELDDKQFIEKKYNYFIIDFIEPYLLKMINCPV